MVGFEHLVSVHFVYVFFHDLLFAGSKLGKDKRSNSSVSEGSSSLFPIGNSRRPSRAFLIKQKDSGEETLVTLTPVVTGVPTIVGPNAATVAAKYAKGSMSSIESHSNDLEASAQALEAQRVEKIVRNLRKQASGSIDEETR